MSALRGALIGCGFFSINHLHAWQDVDGADIVAICDLDAARLTLVGDQFAIGARYVDAQDMLARETLDFVDIATTAPTHRSLVELAASHELGVICQKPFATSLEEARAMVAVCERAGVPLMIHENFRWQSAHPGRPQRDRFRCDRGPLLGSRLVPVRVRCVQRSALSCPRETFHH